MESVPVDFRDYESEKDDLPTDNKIAELSEIGQAAIDKLLQESGEVVLPVRLG